MKKLTLLILFLLSLSFIVIATVTHTLDDPDNYFETTDTSVRFNWTATTTVDDIVTSYLYISESGNESNLVINQTLECTNSTECNVTVTGFNVGFYKWYVRALDSQTNATVVGTEASTFNTLTNNSLNITYTVNTVVENCIVTFTNSSTLTIAEAITNITQTSAGCNLTATNVTNSYLNLTTQGYGEDEYITINSAGSNASGILGLTIGTTYGTSTNSTSDIRWFEIKDATNETFFRWGNVTDDVMWLNRNTGDLNVSGDFTGTSAWSNLGSYPAACPAGSAITTLADSVTCTSFVTNPQEYITISTNTTAKICNNTNAGMMYYNNVTFKHYGCNTTDWNALY